MFFLKRSLILFVTIYFCFSFIPAYGYILIPEYLCEIGKKYYEQGNYSAALQEFKKVLIINPNNSLAIEYIELINQSQSPETDTPATYPNQQPQEAATIQDADLSLLRQKEIEHALNDLERPAEAPSYKPVISKVLLLNSSLQDPRFSIEIEKDKSLILRGENITRFLDTQPNIVRIERLNENEITVAGYDYGYTYVHVWDAKGRWTIEFLCVPAKPEGMTLDQELRQSEESAGSFKLRYSLDYSAQDTGRGLDELKRTSYSWNHWLTLNGQTPYGDLDSQASVRTLTDTTDLTYFTAGLTNGKLGTLKDFAIRAFDFSPSLNNLVFSSPNLRGVMLTSPAFEKKLDYTVFWGREGGGKYAGLSPGLGRIRDSFLEGVSLNLTPVEKQLWSVSAFHGSGEDRYPDLNAYGYDFKWEQSFTDWKTGYEVAYDSQNLAHLFTTSYSIPDFRLIMEVRDTAKAFHTMTGGGWRAGETGALTNISYKPVNNLEINSRIDVFQDRLFPNPKNDNWLNEDFNIEANYTLNQWSSLRGDYSLQNELGRLSPIRYHNAGIGFYQTFDLIRRISTYITYRHQDSMNFSSHSNDFIDEKVILGMRTNIIGPLYYYANKELNWLDARFSGVHSKPNAFETGLDWNRQIFDSSFYGNFRLTYRDEEDTISPLSFLSGEDYLDWSGEITYRPRPDFEVYCSARVRNIWGDNPGVVKRIDASLYAGLRYAWDTGVHWDPVGTIRGCAFKDYNYDGLRQNDEAGVEGIRVFLGKIKPQVTNASGEYVFSKVRARKVTVTLDTTTIPAGFVLTTPASQEVAVSQSGVSEVSFGLASRTEISGIIFEDTNNNFKFDEKDEGLKGVKITLEDGTGVVSDESGRYTFNKAKIGKHTLKLDLGSLPFNYIPTIPILKEIDLSEGATYIHNIPLKKIQD